MNCVRTPRAVECFAQRTLAYMRVQMTRRRHTHRAALPAPTRHPTKPVERAGKIWRGMAGVKTTEWRLHHWMRVVLTAFKQKTLSECSHNNCVRPSDFQRGEYSGWVRKSEPVITPLKTGRKYLRNTFYVCKNNKKWYYLSDFLFFCNFSWEYHNSSIW